MKNKTNLVKLALKDEAIIFDLEDPKNPLIFRMGRFMGYCELRTLLTEILSNEYAYLCESENKDSIIGGIGLNATGIITIISKKLELDCFGVEEHNMQVPGWIKGHEVIGFSPLIRTATTTINGINAIRSAGGICDNIFSVFNEDKTIISERLSGIVGVGNRSHEGKVKLNKPCEVHSLYTPRTIIPIFEEICAENEEKNLDLKEQVKKYAELVGVKLGQCQQLST